ncbi:MAG: alpha/beta fold hydrolase [Hyphomonadaceae bacterium]
MRGFLIGLLILIGLGALVAAGGYFTLRRPDIPLATLEQRYGDQRSQYQDLPNGVRMHFRDEGVQTRPTLLLVHGFSSSLHTWEPWTRILSDRYRLISIDLPGHGLTDAPATYEPSTAQYARDIEAFARARGIEHFALAGNSMGGHVAWEYALAHPNQLDALILVDAAGWAETRSESQNDPQIFRLLRNPVLGPLLIQLDNTRLVREGLRGSFHDPAFANDGMVRRYIELARAPGHREILRRLLIGSRDGRPATNELLAGIRTPTLILHGGADTLVPVEHGRQFAGAIPGSDLVIWEDDGHLPQEEHPQRSADALAAFLARVYEQQAIGSPLEPQQNVTPAQ